MYAQQTKPKSNLIIDKKKEISKNITTQKKTFSAINSLQLSKLDIFQPKVNKQEKQADTKTSLSQSKSNRMGLPDQLKNRIESLSGYRMDDVNVHYNSSKPAQLQALAYTQGREIFVAPGQEKHLGHEAWHVVQQMQGRVPSTTKMKGVNINDDPALEHEADIMGGTTVQFKNNQNTDIQPESPQSSIIQLEPDPKYENDVNFKDNPKEYLQINIPSSEKLTEYFLDRANTFCNEYLYFPLFDIIKEKIKEIKNDESILTNELQDMDRSKAGEIWNSIHDKFLTKENIHTIIGKSFSPTTGADYKTAIWCINTFIINENFKLPPENTSDDYIEKLTIKYLQEFINTHIEIFDDLNVTVGETLNDIFYWSCKQKIESDSSNTSEARPISYGKEVTEIHLTDSDVHTRGIGVCIVTFKDGQKLVVKPERKDFEKTVYGSNDDQSGQQSLASVFNGLGHNVGELHIDVSEKHGSAVEYFDHKDIEQMDNEEIGSLNIESINDIIEFASLLGLGDLHHENMVYGVASKNAQLIDAEVGMKYPLSFSPRDNPFLISMGSGELGNATPNRVDVRHHEYTNEHTQEKINGLKAFLDDAETKLSGLRGRRVILSTGDLYRIRNKIYWGEDYKLDKYKKDLGKR